MKRNIINIILILLTVAIAGCGDKPLFTELADNRIKVIIKATYESNSPRPWEIDFSNPNSWDDSVDDLNLSTPEITTEVNDNLIIPPTKFMLDIAEMRVSDGSFSQRFANYRKTYSQGLNKNASLFNGTGVIYKNDDVRPGFEWRFIKVYLRKMLFDSAKIYYYNDNNVIDGIGTWSFVENDKDIFAEEDVEGLNFIIYQINSYYDSLLYQASSINRIFPLSIKIDDPFIFDNELPETVIEIRFVIKNFIKKYELDYFPDGKERRVKHFYAPADWLRDVKAGRVYSSIKAGPMNDCEVMGRNIIATARTYIPGQTVTIKGKADNSECYVIAINGNHDISEYQITDAERQRPEETDGKPLDEPKLPILDLPADLENVLDYYLKFEKYKVDYDGFIDNVQLNDEETEPFKTAWTDYEIGPSGEEGVSNFHIPPLVTWYDEDAGDNPDGTFTLTNVPVGHPYATYTIYQSECSGSGTACAANELPGSFTRVSRYKTFKVTEDQAGETINLDELFP